MLTSKMSQGLDLRPDKLKYDDTVGIDTQLAAIPKVPRQVSQTLREYAKDMGAVQPTAAASGVYAVQIHLSCL